MLRITVNQELVDISPDTSISLSFANPIFEDDKIPTPHSYSFSLPASSRNLSIFGQVQRISATHSSKLYSTQIWFGAVNLIEGNLVINSITDTEIDVELECATFLDRFKKKLHQIDLGRISFGTAKERPRGDSGLNTSENAALFDAFWKEQLSKAAPDYIATPLAVADEKWADVDIVEDDRPVNPQGGSVNIRKMRINQYNENGYQANPLIPAVRIGYILSKLHPNLSEIFDTAEFKKLMLVCNYHPNYYNEARAGRVWTIDPVTKEVYVSIADYMPDVEIGKFIDELLKMICASLYTVGGEPVVTLNKTVLTSPPTVDWSDKIIDGYKQSFLAIESYRFSFNRDEDEELSPDNVIKDYSDTFDMIYNRYKYTEQFCRLTNTGQVFDSYINAALSNETRSHYSFALVKDGSACSGAAVDTDDSDDTMELREVSCDLIPVRNVLVEEVPRDGMRGPSFNGTASLNPYNYIPEVSKVEKTRPSDCYLGYFSGLQAALLAAAYSYPAITAIGVAPSIPLVNDGIFNARHTEFASWLGKVRRVVNCQIKLDPLDIQTLDLQKKVGFRGNNFLIRELGVTINYDSIELADIELIEV